MLPKMLPLREFPISALDAPGMARVAGDFENLLVNATYDIEYARRGETALHLTLLIPERQSMELEPDGTAYPLVVFVQGSGWQKQEIGVNLYQLGRVAQQGFVVASVEHRSALDAPFPAQIEDVKTAIRFLRKNAGAYHILPEQVALWGCSSGGHTAVMAGLTAALGVLDPGGEGSCEVCGVVDYFGPTEIARMSESPSTMGHIGPDTPEGVFLGGVNVLEALETARRASPSAYISAGRKLPRIAIFHGNRDRKVPFSQSVLLYEALRAAGQTASLTCVEGADHGGPAFWCDAVFSRTIAELRQMMAAANT